MEKDKVFIKVKESFSALFELDPDSISPEKKVDEDLGLDSLDMVDFVMTLNDEDGLLSKKIEPSLFKDVHTVQDIADILRPYCS